MQVQPNQTTRSVHGRCLQAQSYETWGDGDTRASTPPAARGLETCGNSVNNANPPSNERSNLIRLPLTSVQELEAPMSTEDWLMWSSALIEETDRTEGECSSTNHPPSDVPVSQASGATTQGLDEPLLATTPTRESIDATTDSEAQREPYTTHNNPQAHERETNPANAAPTTTEDTARPEEAGTTPSTNPARTKRAATKIASLNIKGYGTTLRAESENTEHKWFHVNQIMKLKKISILAVQETHLTDARRAELETVFPKLKIYMSAHPDHPTRRGGIAIVINKTLIREELSSETTVVRGRALELNTTLHRGTKLRVLAVYAPNDPTENAEFWTEIRNYYNGKSYSLDMMVGDTNMVEDAIDRLPAHLDSFPQVNAMAELKNDLGLVDGWRQTFPKKREFTFTQNNSHSHSRIDRIYIAPDIFETTRDWRNEPSGIPGADHDMIAVQVVDTESPEIGKGRWSMPHYLTADKILIDKVRCLGVEMVKKMENISVRSENNNPQNIYRVWKSKIKDEAIKRSLQMVPKLQTELNQVENEIKEIKRIGTEDLPDVDRGKKLNELAMRRRSAMERLHMKKRRHTRLKCKTDGESMTKAFAARGRLHKPRDIIYALRKGTSQSNEPTYETNSKKMANIAMKYHNSLQEDGLQELEQESLDRETQIVKATQLIKNKLNAEQIAHLEEAIEAEELSSALRLTKSDSAAGLDGLTYEFIKAIEKKAIKDRKAYEAYKDNPKEGEAPPPEPFSMIDALIRVMRDVEKYGVTDDGQFAEGWMCPIYKKDEKDEIANYRPITLLNADYKLYTKSIAMRLAGVAGDIITEEQAGFIPRRQISNQTQLVKMVMEWAEAKEINGVIIALDQEKAYDKVAHDYIWRVLEGFSIPDPMINVIRKLYTNANTRVCINGIMSDEFRVKRGVRQGDPLSCLLFDLAIEPLSLALQESLLKGYNVPGKSKRLITSLFADDTTVFLAEDDDISALESILSDWCKASRAKFNVKKTEVLPIGSIEYRNSVETTRRMHPEGQQIPASMKIVPKGGMIRILGAWYANGATTECPWGAVEDKIKMALGRWTSAKVTTMGRRHVIQMVIGGYTQYLTQVHGMPNETKKRLKKKIKEYMWGGKFSRVNIETAMAPTSMGGLKVLDLDARNDAIDIMWIKRYLDLSEKRPLWAHFSDGLIAAATPKTERKIEPDCKINLFLQSWKTLQGKDNRVCPEIKRMLKTAKKYKIKIINRQAPALMADKMPIWLHKMANKNARRLIHGKASDCLRSTHKVRTVGDIVACIIALTQTPTQQGTPGEDEEHNTELTPHRTTQHLNCRHKKICLEKARALLRTIPTEWKGSGVTATDETRPESQTDPHTERNEEENATNPADQVEDETEELTSQALSQRTSTSSMREMINPESQTSNMTETAGALEQETQIDPLSTLASETPFELTDEDDETTPAAPNPTSHTERKLKEDKWIVFEKRRSEEDLADAVRIFTGTNATMIDGATPDDGPNEFPELIVIATDGSCHGNGSDNARAGAGGYVEHNHELNFAVRVPAKFEQSNQTGELMAIKEACERLHTNTNAFIESDSRYAIESLTLLRERHEDDGYISIANKELIQETVKVIKSRQGLTAFLWVKGHSGHERNEGADEQANIGANRDPDEDNEQIDDQSERDIGAKLSKMTQKVAYQGIREAKLRKYKPRPRTAKTVERIVEDLIREGAGQHKPETIWKNIRHKDLDKKASNFMWSLLHDAFMIGDKWLRDNFDEEQQLRSQCQLCNKLEDMTHILLECKDPIRSKIWDQAEEVYRIRNLEWAPPSLGSIAGCGLDDPEKDYRAPKGDTRLKRIVISESASLIWAMRCQRVIGTGPSPSKLEATARWVKAMDERIERDCFMLRRSHKATNKPSMKLVKATWEGLIEVPTPNQDLDAWIWLMNGVLVGKNQQVVGMGAGTEEEEEEEGESEEEGRRSAPPGELRDAWGGLRFNWNEFEEEDEEGEDEDEEEDEEAPEEDNG
jgi:ribonuclease HI/exonuclease III